MPDRRFGVIPEACNRLVGEVAATPAFEATKASISEKNFSSGAGSTKAGGLTHAARRFLNKQKEPVTVKLWYYEQQGKQAGPVPENDLDAMVNSGALSPETLVWTEGMGNWQPYRIARAAAAQPPSGFETGDLGATPVYDPFGDLTPLRDGPDWEKRGTLGWFAALIGTVKGVLLDPNNTFTKMKREGGLGSPLLFVAIAGGIGVIGSVIWQLVFSSLTPSAGAGATAAGATGANAEFARLMEQSASPMVMIILAVFAPAFVVLGSLIGAGITHLCLLMVGGARQPYETTLRVICYSGGSTNLLNIIPLCGGFASGIWQIVAAVIGLSKAHEISVGKALFAVLLPVIVCCGVVLGLVALGVGAAVSQGIKP